MIDGPRAVVTIGEQCYTLHLDAVAIQDTSQYSQPIQILSVAGPATSVKAVTAGFQTNRAGVSQVTFHDVEGRKPFRGHRGYEPYNCYKHRLGLDTWHLVVISTDQNLLLTVSDEAIWRHLTSDRYTTPLLRTWMPWLVSELREKGHVREHQCVNCQTAHLYLTEGKLDEIVSLGINRGELRMEAAA